MDFFTYFKRFFGLGHGINRGNDQFFDEHPERNDQFWDSRPEEPSRRFNNYNEEPDDSMNSVFSFNVFTDPVEMHSYFEHKMNELMRQFGMGSEDSFFGNNFQRFPAIGQAPEQGPGIPRTLRDQYLKPGYHSTEESDENHKVDGDLDGKISSADLDTLFKDKSKQQMVPYQQKPQRHFFGQSVTSRTIQRSDGTYETHRTVRDQDGNEETTITRKRGDQEYTVITRRDKTGQEERTENLKNLDEKELSDFLNSNNNANLPEVRPPNWFDFDKFFK